MKHRFSMLPESINWPPGLITMSVLFLARVCRRGEWESAHALRELRLKRVLVFLVHIAQGSYGENCLIFLQAQDQLAVPKD